MNRELMPRVFELADANPEGLFRHFDASLLSNPIKRKMYLHIGACARDVGIGRLAARHGGVAALLDNRSAFPGAGFGQIGGAGYRIVSRQPWLMKVGGTHVFRVGGIMDQMDGPSR
jgi:hypothetical protein